MNYRVHTLLSLLALSLTQTHTHAQQTIPTVAPPPRPVTLAQALKAMPTSALPEGATLLCVGANNTPPAPASNVTLTPDGQEQQTDETGVTQALTNPLDKIAADYNQSRQFFGHVEALAPPTMTLLNTDPNLANLPLADLVTTSPLPFLLGTLTDDQWKQLCDTGLQVQTLSADQQGLLQAALPRPFRVAPTSTAMPSLSDAETQTVPDDILTQSHLRAYLDTDYTFDVPGQDGYGIGVAPSATDNAPNPNVFELADTFGTQTQTETRLSAFLKADVPNALKDSDLHWNRHELNATLPLDNLRTCVITVLFCLWCPSF